MSESSEKKLRFEDLVGTITKDHYLVVDPESNLFSILDENGHVDRIFRVVSMKPFEFEEIKIDFDKIAEKLADHVDKVALIRDALKTTIPPTLVEMAERLEKPRVSIKQEKGCYKMLIGGKRGAPLEWMILEGQRT